MRDGNSDNVVYTSIDTDWIDIETSADITKTGYRLPSSIEWEYAARYLGTNAPTTEDDLDTERKYGNDNSDWTDGYYWSPWDYASGATSANKYHTVAVYIGADPSPRDEAAVKSLGPDSANSLGLYDMSGNVEEWCFTERDSQRDNRGGHWKSGAGHLLVGVLLNDAPNFEIYYLGFRLCRTAD